MDKYTRLALQADMPRSDFIEIRLKAMEGVLKVLVGIGGWLSYEGEECCCCCCCYETVPAFLTDEQTGKVVENPTFTHILQDIHHYPHRPTCPVAEAWKLLSE